MLKLALSIMHIDIDGIDLLSKLQDCWNFMELLKEEKELDMFYSFFGRIWKDLLFENQISKRCLVKTSPHTLLFRDFTAHAVVSNIFLILTLY
ncbi:hypothetical protein VNO77_02026 [Canavalia gladiata]|uniref:Uncharacterized protein n=1 Tax=Canavalia gladiata TaxID=3824 RepID=A0AAN9MXD7_CANGL